MIYGILFIGGIIGLSLLLWVQKPPYEPNEALQDSPWYSLEIDSYDDNIFIRIQKLIRSILKRILIIGIMMYQKLSRKINLKQKVKQRIRAFLSDHHDAQRVPSDFWQKVRRFHQKQEGISRKEQESSSLLEEK